MPTTSNLYAEKIYAEHPVYFWSLDDSLDELTYSGGLPVEDEVLPTGLGLTYSTGVPINEYSAKEKSAYYIVEYVQVLDPGDPQYPGFYRLCTKSSGIPMTFGSSRSTRIYPNTYDLGSGYTGSDPSLIFKSGGFLAQYGASSDYTAEFWMRINTQSTEYQRIFGPIQQSAQEFPYSYHKYYKYFGDGIYIKSGFIKLSIGDSFGSYAIGNSDRPMLIDVVIEQNTASLMINGEKVISFNINKNSINYQSPLFQDWMAFYSYNEITNFEIDNIAIYNYSVSPTVAKRRFVYGQGVDSSSIANKQNNGQSAVIDYTFSDYTANYMYPDFAKWDQAKFENLKIDKNFISIPDYSAPLLYSFGISNEQFYEECYLQYMNVINGGYQITGYSTRPFLYFQPYSINGNAVGNARYLYLSKIGIINENIDTLFMVYKAPNFYGSIENDDIATLFKIEDSSTGNYFRAYVQRVPTIVTNAGPIFELKYNGVSTLVDSGYVTTPNYSSFPPNYYGEAFIGINIPKLIETYGENFQEFFANISNYSLYIAASKEDNSSTGPYDIRVYSFGICSDANRKSNSSLNDLCIGSAQYPSTGVLIPRDATDGPTLISLIDHIATYTVRPKVANETMMIDIGISGYWEDYMPLSYFSQYISDIYGATEYTLDFLQFNIDYPANKKIETLNSIDYFYNTEGESLRSYISIQYVENGANEDKTYFDTIVKAKPDSVIYFDDYANWKKTLFEVVDNTVIYVPSTINPEKLAVVYRLEFSVDGIINNPLQVKKLEISGQTLNRNGFTKIGTKNGVDIYPYRKSGIYYNYDLDIPLSIYKGNTPYLYLSENSGIRIKDYDQTIDKGVTYPINTQMSANYEVGSVQIWMKYDESPFADWTGNTQDVKIFEIEYDSDTIEFYLTNSESFENVTRCDIEAKLKSSGSAYAGQIEYVINGNVSATPKIIEGEWTSVGINLLTKLTFDNYIGYLNLTGPLIYNNISIFKDYSNIKKVYTDFLGTNKDIFDDQEGISIDINKIKIYSDTSWSSISSIPA